MPFICKRRTDIQDGILQISDLWPSKTLANGVSDPRPQGPRYISGPVTNTVVLASTGATQRYFPSAQSGLAAYLVANVQADGAGGAALTPTEANVAAAAILTRMRAGNSLTLANINTILVAAAGAGTELTSGGGSNSTGSVTDILRILAGATYTVPAGTICQVVVSTFNPQSGPAAWNAANFDFNTFTDVLAMDSSFYISLAQGHLNGFTSTSFRYRSTTGAALVVYSDSGDVL